MDDGKRVIDSHCHLADPKFASDLEAVIAHAALAGVGPMVTIADSLDEGEKCLAITEKFDQIFCTIGVHPHNASVWGAGSGAALLEMLRRSPKVVALGEIGLDYHYMYSPKDGQRETFLEQLRIADALKLPVVLHNRESLADLKEILSRCRPKKAVLHCCTEKWEDVADLVDEGYLLSFTGIATYPKSHAIRATIKQCPLEQMMIETDAPYLAPQAHRGLRNEPAFVTEVAKCVAEVKGLTLEEVDTKTTANAVKFYGLK